MSTVHIPNLQCYFNPLFSPIQPSIHQLTVPPPFGMIIYWVYTKRQVISRNLLWTRSNLHSSTRWVSSLLFVDGEAETERLSWLVQVGTTRRWLQEIPFCPTPGSCAFSAPPCCRSWGLCHHNSLLGSHFSDAPGSGCPLGPFFAFYLLKSTVVKGRTPSEVKFFCLLGL